ncbi:cytochrome c oxidase assembly protein [Alteribacillus sp. HJP-4]|uniref:cytochrome c oxidase assembly protein n=1 Tax=Alteribacillus sp. HJP-4 TaxID=2775394 RepID=UPI0035CD2D76
MLGVYVAAAVMSMHQQKHWPWYRIILWIVGVCCAIAAVAGPLARQAHMDFTIHMLGHLLLGMLAPLFMVMAAPMTLFLRTLPVTAARKLSRMLKSMPVRFFTHPAVAALLNIGGLWILYTTSLYEAMHQYTILHLLIHMHVFTAGLLFTASIIYIDPAPHRKSFVYRGVVLLLALAGHGILSKFVYANPPAGVSSAQAENGGMLMYYGGDVIDLVIIFILCLHWYRSAKPRERNVRHGIDLPAQK